MSTEQAPRVLVSGVVLGQPVGGVRRHNEELLPRLAERLSSRGGALAVLEGRTPLTFPLPNGVERIPSDVPAGPPVVRAAFEGHALRAALEGARREGRPFDLVHTAHLPVPLSLPVPFTLTLHDLRSLDLHHSPFSRRLVGRVVIGRAAKRAACVFTVSDVVRERLIGGWSLDPARVLVVPNAADHFEPLPRTPATDAPLLHVGHVEPRKNLLLLIHALKAAPELPAVRFAGAPRGGEEERLRRAAAELGVTDRVAFTGAFANDELPGLLAGASCVVLPSHLEGFGIVALEAQRARVPLALSDIPAHVEVAGDNVPRFAPDDPAACARAVREALATSESTLEEHALRAERFSWDDSAARWESGLQRVLEGTASQGTRP